VSLTALLSIRWPGVSVMASGARGSFSGCGVAFGGLGWLQRGHGWSWGLMGCLMGSQVALGIHRLLWGLWVGMGVANGCRDLIFKTSVAFIGTERSEALQNMVKHYKP
jgi:hypothetical protein